ncbi:MAG: phosphatidic acid phosphatase, partial [Marinirhabdus sp.]
MKLKSKPKLPLVAALLMAIGACAPPGPIEVTPAHFQNTVDKVTEIMVHDIFSPPVASRIYVYPNIAAYEIIARGD